ncbi:hypothetical protein JKF63_00740 [Porcisia hertigi]|uniref:Peptidase S9 prolyl oligopeptidase catalytic domain-containing protein n=1 Tax=Porcisia hertigi TaxID=2761500 RepID=A0A836HDM9_9TRYP|nr:hypothetical protein JKF63_00740 [Porcisia hertigi]
MSAEKAVLKDGAMTLSEEVAVDKVLVDDMPSKVPRQPLRWFALVMTAVLLFLVVPLRLWWAPHFIRGPASNLNSLFISYTNDSDTHYETDTSIDAMKRRAAQGHAYPLSAEPSEGCASGAPVFPKGEETVVSFTTKDNEQRSAVVYVPESYPMETENGYTRPVALMVQLHGLNDNCMRFLRHTGFKTYADLDGFVIVSLCGSQGYLGTGWNAGTCCGFAGDLPDDVAFAKQVVVELSQKLCIDKDRVMAVGFSNGAMLSEVLACEAPDIFRAVASVAGVVELRPGNEAGLQACTTAVEKASSTARTSVLMVHGTADLLVPWAGNALLGFPSTQLNVDGWVTRNGCTGNPITTINTHSYSNLIYDNCTIGTHPADVFSRAKPGKERVGSEEAHEYQWCREEEKEASALPGARTRSEADVECFFAEVSLGGIGGMGEDGRLVTKRRYIPSFDGEVAHRTGTPMCKRKKYRYMEGGGHMKGLRAEMWNIAEGKHDHARSHPRTEAHWPSQPLRKHHWEAKHRKRHVRRFSRTPREGWGASVEHNIIPRGRNGTSEVELVRVNGGSHGWPSDIEFSTTDYIYRFGLRIFGLYN